jgi:hypothetical protein
VSSHQAIALCAALGASPNDSVNGEPRYVAVQRVFDEDAADASMKDHEDRAKAGPPKVANTGTRQTTMAVKGGGGK